MTSVDTDPLLCTTERNAVLQRLGAGSWKIFGAHGMMKEYCLSTEQGYCINLLKDQLSQKHISNGSCQDAQQDISFPCMQSDDQQTRNQFRSAKGSR